MVYDGTTRLGEALAIVLHYVGIIGLSTTVTYSIAASSKITEITCELIGVLSTAYGSFWQQ